LSRKKIFHNFSQNVLCSPFKFWKKLDQKFFYWTDWTFCRVSKTLKHLSPKMKLEDEIINSFITLCAGEQSKLFTSAVLLSDSSNVPFLPFPAPLDEDSLISEMQGSLLVVYWSWNWSHFPKHIQWRKRNFILWGQRFKSWFKNYNQIFNSIQKIGKNENSLWKWFLNKFLHQTFSFSHSPNEVTKEFSQSLATHLMI